jgi:protein-disulfide isomerase
MKKTKNSKKYTSIIIGIVAAVTVVVGLIFFVVAENRSSGQAAPLAVSVLQNGWAKGNKDAKVKLVEYSDFQCPACGAYYPLVKRLNEEFGDRIEFTYRHFPLSQIHLNADLAAHAAEAAGRQGKFWEMHDMLFENQQAWSETRNTQELFTDYAASLGLEAEQFARDVDSKEVKEKVKADYTSGIESGVNGTPTFFLNGKRLVNPKDYDAFRNIIIAELGSNS